MDNLVMRFKTAFAKYSRPDCVIVHASSNACLDCWIVSSALEKTNCDLVMSASNFQFSSIPMDCMNAEAILHYMPAIVHQVSQANGGKVAESIIWILSAVEWDSDKTINEQIKPLLNAVQRALILEFLDSLKSMPLCSHSAEQLKAACEIWKQV